MGDENQHPITTAKGSAILTVVAAVIGVIAPLLNEAAVVVAMLAIFFIIWLHWSEITALYKTHRYQKELSVPIFSIVLILIFVCAAIWKFTNEPSIQNQLNERVAEDILDKERAEESADIQVKFIIDKQEGDDALCHFIIYNNGAASAKIMRIDSISPGILSLESSGVLNRVIEHGDSYRQDVAPFNKVLEYGSVGVTVYYIANNHGSDTDFTSYFRFFVSKPYIFSEPIEPIESERVYGNQIQNFLMPAPVGPFAR